MAEIDGSKALDKSGSTATVRFGGGVRPGIVATDTFASNGDATFSVTVMGTSLYSATSAALVTTGASRSSAETVQEVLCVLVRELIRKGILKGTYAAA